MRPVLFACVVGLPFQAVGVVAVPCGAEPLPLVCGNLGMRPHGVFTHSQTLPGTLLAGQKVGVGIPSGSWEWAAFESFSGGFPRIPSSFCWSEPWLPLAQCLVLSLKMCVA